MVFVNPVTNVVDVLENTLFVHAFGLIFELAVTSLYITATWLFLNGLR